MWFCGLPGSGKSTLARSVSSKLGLASEGTIIISMDSIRKKMFPNPRYTDEERDAAYRAFVLLGSMLSKAGKNVILDGTGHKKVWRDFARSECPRFVEICVKCPVEICLERETSRPNHDGIRKKLYIDALDRLKTGKSFAGLGNVPGVDEPFEEDNRCDITINSSEGTIDSQTSQIVTELQRLGHFREK